MRDTVAATGLRFEEIDEKRAAELGCLSAVLRLHLAGRLSRKEFLCNAAARSGQLEKLKLLRAGGCPWDEGTCWAAAEGGHLEVLKWARANGCKWGVYMCRGAAEGRQLEVLLWAHANGCPWDAALQRRYQGRRGGSTGADRSGRGCQLSEGYRRDTAVHRRS